MAANLDAADGAARGSGRGRGGPRGPARVLHVPRSVSRVVPRSPSRSRARSTDRLAAVARADGMWVLGGSVLERDDDHVFDTSVLIDRTGEVVARYRKIHLYDVDLPGQPPVPRVGHDHAGRSARHARDRVRPGGVVDLLRRAIPGAVPRADGAGRGGAVRPRAVPVRDREGSLARAAARARDRGPVLRRGAGAVRAASATPRRDGAPTGTASSWIPWGRVLVEGSEDEPGVWFADLDFTELRRIRQALPALSAPPPRAHLLIRADRGGLELDDDRERVDVDAVFRFLSEEAYWVRGRSRDDDRAARPRVDPGRRGLRRRATSSGSAA